MMTTIHYTKNRLVGNARLGGFFIAIGGILLLTTVANSNPKENSLVAMAAGQLAAGLFLLSIYWFEKHKQYLTLKNDVLIKNTLIPKKVPLKQVTQIKEFAGDIVLVTPKGEFVIDTQVIDPESLRILRAAIQTPAASTAASRS